MAVKGRAMRGSPPPQKPRVLCESGSVAMGTRFYIFVLVHSFVCKNLFWLLSFLFCPGALNTPTQPYPDLLPHLIIPT